MNPKRSYYFRGVLTGLLIVGTYTAFTAGAFFYAIAGLASIAIISNAALGAEHGG